MIHLSIAGAMLACVVLWPGSVRADTYTAAGLSFSDELGGFRLISASGAGTLADPLVVVEEISKLGSTVLVVRDAQATQRLSQFQTHRAGSENGHRFRQVSPFENVVVHDKPIAEFCKERRIGRC